MIKVQIAGFMSNAIDTDMDYIASPSIDIEKMESDTISGFDFRLPKSIIGYFYSSNDVEVEITDISLEHTQTFVNVDSSSSLVVNEKYWIKNELISIVSIVSSTRIEIARGLNKTFANRYIRDEILNIPYYIRKLPKTIIGQRVFLYSNEKLITIGIIKNQIKFNGTSVSFSCTNALDALDVPFTFPTLSQEFYAKGLIRVQSLFKSLNKYELINNAHNYYKSEMPPILDYISIPVPYTLFPLSSTMTALKIADAPKIKEFLGLYGKINGLIFGWNQSYQEYTFLSISDISSFDSIASLKIGDYIKINDLYSSNPYSGIGQVSIKISDKLTINLNSVNVMQFSKDSILKIDVSKYLYIKSKDISSTLFYYQRLFSVIYASFTIPTTYKKYYDFKIGMFYDITDLDNFFTFQNVSKKAFCLKKDEGKITFLIIRDIEKNPVAPAIEGEIISNNIFKHLPNIRDFLDCNCNDAETAELKFYNYKFFEVGDKMDYIDNIGNKTTCSITNISSNEITLDTSFSNGKGYLRYSDISNITSRQKAFFYLNNNKW